MFTTHQHQAVSRQTALLLLTVILLGLSSSALFGATGNGENATPPGLFPAGAEEAAAPMNGNRAVSFAADARQAIELQNAGKWEDAAIIWGEAATPCESEVWRHLSIGVAQFYLGNLDRADEQLAVALELNRENPVVRYFVGLLRIEQASLATASVGSALPGDARLADNAPDQPSTSRERGKAKSRLELEAINELETAITHFASLDFDAPLAKVTWVIPVPYPVSEPLVSPSIGELLDALGADHLAGKAHGLLAVLYLDQGLPDQAEYHIDEASVLGVVVPYAYRTAGKLYEERGQNADAFRVYLKAMQQGEGIITPGTKALRSFGNAWEELF